MHRMEHGMQFVRACGKVTSSCHPERTICGVMLSVICFPQGFFIAGGRLRSDGFECGTEKSVTAEAAALPDLRKFAFPGGKEGFGQLYALLNKILPRRSVIGGFEQLAEIFRCNG